MIEKENAKARKKRKPENNNVVLEYKRRYLASSNFEPRISDNEKSRFLTSFEMTGGGVRMMEMLEIAA